MKPKTFLLLSTAAAIVGVQPAFAQTGTPPDATGTTASSVPGGATQTQTVPPAVPAAGATPADAPVAGARDAGDIIVTARRREEKLQDVPLTVQAFSEATLARRGVTRVDDLQQTTPSLSIQSSPQGRRDLPRFEIRGISSDEALLSQDQSVAVYFDEVYQARPAGVNQQLYDLESVQVLSGPQGTLFGRNSTAGALLLTSKRPTDRLEGELSATYGNYDRRELRGVLNIPLSDSLKVRFSGQRLLRDGFTRDIGLNRRLDNTNAWTGRASVLFDPGNGFTNLTVSDYFHAHDNLSNNVLTAVRACAPATGLPAPFNTLLGSPPLGCLYGPVGNAILGTPNIFTALANQQRLGVRTVQYDTPSFSRTTAYGISNVTTIPLSDDWTVKNIIGHRRTKSVSLLDLEGTYVHVSGTSTRQIASTFSEELQLQGDLLDSRLSVVGGGFFFREKGNEFTNSDALAQVNPAGNPVIINADGINTSRSIYAQATYKFGFLEGLSATVGGRYTWDTRRLKQLSDSTTGPARTTCYYLGPNNLPLNPCGRNLKFSSSEPTWTLGLDYKAAKNVLLYATSRRGYRAGGFTFRSASDAQTAPFKPETVTDGEVGIKADWDLGGGMQLRTNADYYQIYYNNIQRTVATAGPSNTIIAIIKNAAKARINGFEATVNFSPVRGVDLGGFWGHVDAKHTRFNTLINGVNVTLQDVPFTNSKNSFGLNASVAPVDSPEAGTLTLTGNYSYRSAFYGPNSLPDIEPESRVPGQGTANLTLDWAKILGSNFSGQLFMRNVTNKKFIVGVLSLQDALGLTTRTYGDPRMYGLTLKYTFGR